MTATKDREILSITVRAGAVYPSAQEDNAFVYLQVGSSVVRNKEITAIHQFEVPGPHGPMLWFRVHWETAKVSEFNAADVVSVERAEK